MPFEFLLEEETSEKVLDNLMPEIITGDHTYRCIRFQGKIDLLKNLSIELKGYSKWMPDDYRIVILLDKDRDDCVELKTRLNKMAADAGLTTKSSSQKKAFHVLNRIAIEEIEAWLFGDANAMRMAYPGCLQILKVRPYIETLTILKTPGKLWNVYCKEADILKQDLEKQRRHLKFLNTFNH